MGLIRPVGVSCPGSGGRARSGAGRRLRPTARAERVGRAGTLGPRSSPAPVQEALRGRSSMVEPQSSKLATRVRFPSSAPWVVASFGTHLLPHGGKSRGAARAARRSGHDAVTVRAHGRSRTTLAQRGSRRRGLRPAAPVGLARRLTALQALSGCLLSHPRIFDLGTRRRAGRAPVTRMAVCVTTDPSIAITPSASQPIHTGQAPLAAGCAGHWFEWRIHATDVLRVAGARTCSATALTADLITRNTRVALTLKGRQATIAIAGPSISAWRVR